MPDKQPDKAVSPEVLETIREIQALPSFANFALAGGTNLALRFNHRRSIDIDLFSNSVVGMRGLEQMTRELENRYGAALIFCEILDPENGEQFCFLKALVSKGDIKIKVEVIQNIQVLDPLEVNDGVRMLSMKDIALLKLMSASNRKAKKDIYDLDLLSNEIDLQELIETLKIKLDRFGSEECRCLFIMPHSKSWVSARISWKMKVKTLMRKNGTMPPPANPIN